MLSEKGCCSLREKFKSTLLVFLILSSMALTYWLWFGRLPLEEGTAPRYEYAYFTPPPSLPEIVQPVEIVFFGEEQVHLFRRGEDEHRRLWAKGWQILARELDPEKMKRSSSDDLEAAWETASFKLVYSFDPSFPLEFISGRLAVLGMNTRKITFLWGKDSWAVFTEGEEILSLTLPGDAGLPDELLPARTNPCIQLPPVLVLSVAGEFAGETGDGDFQPAAEAPAPGELHPVSAASTDNVGSEPVENWEVKVSKEIFVEEDDLLAAEISLEKENIQRDELVKAFFLDLSMARRIEEKDGAFYFTNGEKGLRIYASGLVEFTAPRLESSLRQQMPYGLALQKGAESQSLYGGYLPDTYLCDARGTRNGYRFLWRRITGGLVWEGENTGCEILLDEQGVSFYQRNFLAAGEETATRWPFRSYEEALCQALSLHREHLPEKKATLLSLRPVYYLSEEKNEQAIPAWAVNFAETGVIYLHWSTLEPL